MARRYGAATSQECAVADIVTHATAACATADGTMLLADGAQRGANLAIGADDVRDAMGFQQRRRCYADGRIPVLAERARRKGGGWDPVICFRPVSEPGLGILYTPVSGMRRPSR